MLTLRGTFPDVIGAIVQCRWQDTSFTPAFLNMTSFTITCASPKGSGRSPLSLTFNGVVSDAVLAGVFSFFKIVSISPSRGPTSGGTLVTLSGDGFVSASLFWCGWTGDASVIAALRISDQALVCALPVTRASRFSALSTTQITVTADNATFSVAQNFSTYPSPVVTHVAPRVLPSGGGLVTILGSNFAAG